MQTHPDIGRELPGKISFLRPCVDIPWCHHETWDGSGCPQALSGKDIPLPARLFAIVDMWDALTHKRVYKDAWPERDVLDHIREQAGRHFDPGLVDIFLANYTEIKREAGVETDFARSPMHRTASSHAAFG